MTPTPAHARACVVGVLVAIGGVLLRRPDVIAIVSPLLVAAVWGASRRPTRAPTATARLAHRSIREGEATEWVATVSAEPAFETVAGAIALPGWVQARPPSAAAVAATENPSTELRIAIRSTRWGLRPIGPGLVGATTAWAAFRWIDTPTAAHELATLPMPATFDAAMMNPRVAGLVGQHLSRRPGDGSEFAGIRPFTVGDRLRRIHWPVSLRTGELHVTATFAEREAHVVLVVDAFNDVGVSEGVDGRASSLDVAVRAAGAIAEHVLHHGDRVGLRILGASGSIRLRPATGQRHLRRVLDALARIEVATNHRDPGTILGESIGAGVLVVLLSPLVSTVPLTRAAELTRHGVPVVVIDTLPPDMATLGRDVAESLAWRIRLLEREREIRRVRSAGVPVVPWAGPGSLDVVLRDVRRRVGAPRVGVR